MCVGHCMAGIGFAFVLLSVCVRVCVGVRVGARARVCVQSACESSPMKD